MMEAFCCPIPCRLKHDLATAVALLQDKECETQATNEWTLLFNRQGVSAHQLGVSRCKECGKTTGSWTGEREGYWRATKSIAFDQSLFYEYIDQVSE